MRIPGLAASMLLLAACAGPERDRPMALTGGSSLGTSGSDGGSAGSSTDGSDDSAGSGGGSTGALYDVGAADGGPTGRGCEKVDFLFVIDNSVSMANQQTSLIASFPSFIATIQETLTATSDYHIMVVDTDAETRCTPENCADPTPNAKVQDLCIDDGAGGYACNTTFTACDTTLGAGVVHPAGEASSNSPCTLFGGNRYIVEGEPALSTTFECIAKVGIAGQASERPMEAMMAALSQALHGPGGCNAGYLRDDAILVVTFISDDPNHEDAGTAKDWYDAVIAAKNGDAEAVVVLGLTPTALGCGPDNPGEGAHWSEFIGLWDDRGIEGSVCEADYGPFFADAVAIIDTTCDAFVPPG